MKSRMDRGAAARRWGVLLGVAVLATTPAAHAGGPDGGMQSVATGHSFDTLVARLERAIEDNRMGLVAEASASRAAAGRGVKIPGNAVLMVFRNDFAVRMLEASVPAGIEAPLRLYVTENPDGSASIAYRSPSATFAPYHVEKLDALARELDPIFARIVSDAAGK